MQGVAECALRARRGHGAGERQQRGRERRQSRPERRREHLWRYNPEGEAEGKTRSDSKDPQWDKFQDYLKGEVRFASVAK